MLATKGNPVLARLEGWDIPATVHRSVRDYFEIAIDIEHGFRAKCCNVKEAVFQPHRHSARD